MRLRDVAVPYFLIVIAMILVALSLSNGLNQSISDECHDAGGHYEVSNPKGERCVPDFQREDEISKVTNEDVRRQLNLEDK